MTDNEIIKRLWLLVIKAEVAAGALDTPTLTTRQVKDVLMADTFSATANEVPR